MVVTNKSDFYVLSIFVLMTKTSLFKQHDWSRYINLSVIISLPIFIDEENHGKTRHITFEQPTYVIFNKVMSDDVTHFQISWILGPKRTGKHNGSDSVG